MANMQAPHAVTGDEASWSVDAATARRLHADGYTVLVPWRVAWGDMDANGHVNNATYFRYFETVRIAFVRAVEERVRRALPATANGTTAEGNGGGNGAMAHPAPAAGNKAALAGLILASIGCKFVRPLAFPDRIVLAAKAVEVTERRLVIRHCVFSERFGDVAAVGDGVMVGYDYASLRRAPIPGPIVAAARQNTTLAGFSAKL